MPCRLSVAAMVLPPEVVRRLFLIEEKKRVIDEGTRPLAAHFPIVTVKTPNSSRGARFAAALDRFS